MAGSVDELLDARLTADLQTLREWFRRIERHHKSVLAGVKDGDLGRVQAALTELRALMSEEPEAFGRVLGGVAQFDFEAYCRTDFDADFRRACKATEIPVNGEFPEYEVFPFLVQVRPMERVVVVNKRRIKGLRMSTIIAEVRKERDLLNRSPFNASDFLKALAASYDTLVIGQKGKSGHEFEGLPVPLKRVYADLTKMPTWRRQYPERLFAFDVHRLLKSGQLEYNGRRCEFGYARNPKNALRIVNERGQEEYYASLVFRFMSGGEP
jgi:hypothetical protein